MQLIGPPMACEAPRLEILLEDGPVLAVNKPAGLLTQGVPQGIVSLEHLVKQYLKECYHKPGNVYLGIPHRLDRPVSGVVVFARNSKAARRLAEQFQQRQVRKIYWGVVEGRPEADEGVLRDWIRKLPDQSRAELADPHSADSRECWLHYRLLACFAGLCLLEIELGTGRMHQIRVQFASRGWPLVGDYAYGASTGLAQQRTEDARAEPIALHARQLTFQHPIRYDTLTVQAPLPANWGRFGDLQHYAEVHAPH